MLEAMLQLPSPITPRHRGAVGPGPRRASAALAAAGLAALAFAAPAAAGSNELYGVEVDAVVETAYTGEAQTPALEHSSSLALSTHLKAGFLASIDRDAGGRIVGATGEDQHVATTTGTITTHEREFAPDWNDWWERRTECTGGGENRNDEGRTSLRPDPLTPLVGASLVLNLADDLLVNASCTDTGRNGGAGPRSFQMRSPVPADEFGPAGPLAVTFQLPAEATRAGKVIQLFEGPAAGHAAYCPEDLAERPYKKSCKVTFHGTVTLTKVDGAQTPRADPPVGGTPGTDDDLLEPLVPAKQRGRLDRTASRLTFRAACPGGCTGTASIRLPVSSTGPRAAARKRMRTVATLRFSVPRSATAATVRLSIPKRARRPLLRARGAVVALSLTDRVGRGTTKATLKLAR